MSKADAIWNEYFRKVENNLARAEAGGDFVLYDDETCARRAYEAALEDAKANEGKQTKTVDEQD